MGGNLDWTIDSSTFYEGEFSAKSGEITDDQTTEISLEIDVLTANEIRFFKKVSSESGYDFLKFYIDETELASWAGELDWSEEVFPVNIGEHVFKWVYSKDGLVSSESDCAWIDNVTLPISFPNLVENEVAIDQYSLKQNYPNPFNPTTIIDYTIPSDQHVEIAVFNLRGEKIADLVNKNIKAGLHKVNFNASRFASGQYLYQFKTKDFTETKKMLLIK